MKEKSYVQWIPAVILALVILVFTATPGATVTAVGLTQETYHINGHFVMYFLLSAGIFKGSKNNFGSFVASTSYGALMEILQLKVPGRAFQFWDVAVNGFGSFLAFLILWKRSSILPKKLNDWLEK